MSQAVKQFITTWLGAVTRYSGFHSTEPCEGHAHEDGAFLAFVDQTMKVACGLDPQGYYSRPAVAIYETATDFLNETTLAGQDRVNQDKFIERGLLRGNRPYTSFHNYFQMEVENVLRAAVKSGLLTPKEANGAESSILAAVGERRQQLGFDGDDLEAGLSAPDKGRLIRGSNPEYRA